MRRAESPVHVSSLPRIAKVSPAWRRISTSDLRDALRAVLVGAGAADPEQNVDRACPATSAIVTNRTGPSPSRRATRRAMPHGLPLVSMPRKAVLDLLRELGLLENEVPPHLDDLVHGRHDEDRAGRRAPAARRAGPDRVLRDPAADQVLLARAAAKHRRALARRSIPAPTRPAGSPASPHRPRPAPSPMKFFGSSGFPVRTVGQTTRQRPHSVQV